MKAPDHVGECSPVIGGNPPPAQATAIPSSLPFRAVLIPHRSLTPNGFLIVMSCLGVVSFAMGLAFAWTGAWPVLGFFGLDVAIVYLAFKLNYRAARATETVEVTRDQLTITRLAANGRRQATTRLSSTWVRLEEIEGPEGSLTLCLAQHGSRYLVARDLHSDERRSFAHALRAALSLVRQPERR